MNEAMLNVSSIILNVGGDDKGDERNANTRFNISLNLVLFQSIRITMIRTTKIKQVFELIFHSVVIATMRSFFGH